MKRPWDAVAWWERRRLTYNVVLAVVGVASMGLLDLSVVHFGGEGFSSPFAAGWFHKKASLILVPIIGYALMANVCYTLGWVSELLWSSGETSRTEARRLTVFRAGLIGSAILTAAPPLLLAIVWIAAGASHAR